MGQIATIVNPANVREVESEMADRNRHKIDFPNDDAIRIFNCFGEASTYLPGPQGFIVDAPAGTEVATHWHPVNQFQVYVGTAGAFYQRSDVRDLALHYTDAYSTYGPFGSRGPGRLRYYTLRAFASDTTGWMPDDRERMQRRGRRNYLVPMPCRDASDRAGHKMDALIEPEPDGLAAYRSFVAPSDRLDAPAIPSAAVGRFYCVLDGALTRDGEQFPAPSMLWQGRGQELPHLLGDDPSGCDVLIVHFPPEADFLDSSVTSDEVGVP